MARRAAAGKALPPGRTPGTEGESDMKITKVETFVVKGLLTPWLFCAVRTDEGITGYSEFGNGNIAHGLVGLVKDLEGFLVGKDPRAVEKLYMDMYRGTRWAHLGAMQQAIAGVELALWDIKGKALNVPVYELMGGPHRAEQRVYWSHLGLYHARNWTTARVKPLRSWDDLAGVVRTAREKGYSAFKTNIVFPGNPPDAVSGGFGGPHEQTLPKELLNHAVKQISVLREAGGDDADILFDININFKTEGAIRIAQAVEPFKLFWVEYDGLDARALRQLKDSTRTPICSGETLLTPLAYHPFFEQHAMDYVKVDVQWMGFGPARRVAEMASLYELNIAPHNYNAHLSTFQSLNLCASVSNVAICESDPLNAYWRDEIFTVLPEVKNGFAKIPTGPGWGTELNEKAAKKHAYEM
jgi:L-alanine-DL-glutamate epimerase-like enolase superfamily enzyme